MGNAKQHFFVLRYFETLPTGVPHSSNTSDEIVFCKQHIHGMKPSPDEINEAFCSLIVNIDKKRKMNKKPQLTDGEIALLRADLNKPLNPRIQPNPEVVIYTRK